MEPNPYQPSQDSADGVSDSIPDQGMSPKSSPVLVYTAGGNLEAHSVVTWLASNEIQAHAVEDNSGLSLFAFGTLSQFHKPQVFVDAKDAAQALQLVEQFEVLKVGRRKSDESDAPVSAECVECGVASEFPASQDGTTQNCPGCGAYMDVGDLGWPEDFDFEGEKEPSPEKEISADEALDAASELETSGDWQVSIAAFQSAADRWPEHSDDVAKCIKQVQQKLDATE